MESWPTMLPCLCGRSQVFLTIPEEPGDEQSSKQSGAADVGEPERPGKRNPPIAEVLAQAAMRVLGNDTTVSISWS